MTVIKTTTNVKGYNRPIVLGRIGEVCYFVDACLLPGSR